jgi:hypothetical protein
MGDEINVITIADDTLLTGIEKQSLFEKWSKEFKQTATFFETFNRVLQEVISRETFFERPEILVLKIRKIAQFPMCIPIVAAAPTGLDTIAKVTAAYGTTGGSSEEPQVSEAKEPQKKPGVDVLFINPQRYYVAASTDNMNVKLAIPSSLRDSVGYAVLQPEMSLNIACNEVLRVVGFLIDRKSPILAFDVSTGVARPSIASMIQSGVYSAEFLQNALLLPWQQYRNYDHYETIMFDPATMDDECDRILTEMFGLVHELLESKIPHEIMTMVYNDALLPSLPALAPLLDDKDDKSKNEKSKASKKSKKITGSKETRKSEKPEKPEKPDKQEKPEKLEKKEKPEKTQDNKKDNKENKKAISDALTIVVTEMRKLLSAGSATIQKVSSMPDRAVVFDDWIEQLSEIGPYAIDDTFVSNVWFDVLRSGHAWLLSRVYLVSSVGIEEKDGKKELSDAVAAAIDDYNALKAGRARAAEDDKKIFASKLMETAYRRSYIERFGYDAYRRLHLVDTLITRDSILDKIRPSEKQIITAMVSRMDFTYHQQVMLPEQKIAQKMRYETSELVRLDLYKSLRHFISVKDLARSPKLPRGGGTLNLSDSQKGQNNQKEQDWIRTKTGAPLICPHIRDTFELLLQAVAGDSMRQYLINCYATETTELFDAYYCRICGEAIAAVSMEGITKAIDFEGYTATPNELLQYIKKHVSWLVSTKIEFTLGYSSRDISEFVETVTTKLFGWIDAVDRKIQKSRSISTVDRENYRKLLTNIYAYAMLMRIVVNNPAKISFRNFHSGKGKSKGMVDKMIQWIVEQITTAYDTTMTALKVTAEYVQTMLLRSYDKIAGIGKIELHTKTVKIGLFDYVMSEPLYQALCSSAAAGVMRQLPLKNWEVASNKMRLLFAQNVSPAALLGSSIAEIESKGAGVFDKAVAPRSDPDIDWLLRYTKSGVYRDHYWEIKLTPDGKLSHIGINAVYSKLMRTLNQPSVVSAAADARVKRARDGSACFGRLAIMRSRMYPGFRSSDVKYLNYVYGTTVNTKHAKLLHLTVSSTELHIHKWDILVFVSAKDYKAGLGLTDYKTIKIWVKSQPFVAADHEGFLILDRFCSLCGNARSDVCSNTEIVEKLREHDLVTAVYEYYTGQCPTPKGDNVVLHTGDPCKNCGLTKHMIDTRDHGYFKRHVKQFEATSVLSTSATTEVSSVADIRKQTVAKLGKFTPTPDIVTEFVDKTYQIVSEGSSIQDSRYVKHSWTKSEYLNLINWVGATEGHDIDTIRTGRGQPKSRSRDAIHKVIMSVFVELDRIVWTDVSVSVRDHDLRLIVDSMAGVKKTALAGISAADVQQRLGLGEYYKAYTELVRSDLDQAGWVYEYLLRMLLQVLQTATKAVSPISCKEIMLHCIATVLSSDVMSSKLKAQKRVEVEAIQSSGEVDPTILDNDNTRMYDDLVDPDYVDKYGYEEMDYDGENEKINS